MPIKAREGPQVPERQARDRHLPSCRTRLGVHAARCGGTQRPDYGRRAGGMAARWIL